MMPLAYRRTIMLVGLTGALIASAAYDSLYVQFYPQFKLPLVGVIAATLSMVLFVQRYPWTLVHPVATAGWPLHLFTALFLGLCLTWHNNYNLDQVIIYSILSYVLYLLIPLILLLDEALFISFVKIIAIVSGALAIPSFIGATGRDWLGSVPLRVKPSYSEFSGIIASGGLFEHVEGHALQMAIGIICCLYLIRKSGGLAYYGWLLLTTLGLIISQGRAAIYGLGVAAVLFLAPPLFRQSKPVFLGTLFMLLTFPFLLLNQLATLPGIASYFRVERGLSGREEAWHYALTVIRENPWVGYGFMASAELTELEQKSLRKSGFTGAGTTFHNTFITKAVDLGIVATGFYLLLYLVPMLNICRPSSRPLEQEFVRAMILLTFTASLYRDYNIGGVRSTALLTAIFLGLANLWFVPQRWLRSTDNDRLLLPATPTE